MLGRQHGGFAIIPKPPVELEAPGRCKVKVLTAAAELIQYGSLPRT